jgi:hypothetical protein
VKIISEPTLDLFRASGPCEWCRRYCRRREPHHLACRGMGGGARLDIPCNLIALGSTRNWDCTCHEKIQRGRIDSADVLALVARREGVTAEDVVAVRSLIWRLDKDASRERIVYEAELAELPGEAVGLLWRSLAVREAA